MRSIGKLYSRPQGWIGSGTGTGTPVKHFNSSVISKLPPFDMNDKTGKHISNHLKANDMENDYKELMHFCNIYPNWHFYYDNEEIFSSESL